MGCGTQSGVWGIGGCDHKGELEALDRLTRFACALFVAGHPVPEELRAWWDKHQAWDALRREQEARQVDAFLAEFI